MLVETDSEEGNVGPILPFVEWAKGSLSISQVATGEENNFTVSIYGDKGALKWSQENPNYATFSQVGESNQIITRGGSINVEGTAANVRIPAGHPEGYLEAFAQIYSDAADVIRNKENKEELLKINTVLKNYTHKV